MATVGSMPLHALDPHPEKRRHSLSENVTGQLLSPIFFEAVPDAMVAVDHHGVIVQVNSQTERLFGYTQGELVGQSVEMLVPMGQREAHNHHRARFQQQPEMRRMGAQLDLHGRRKDGSEFPVEISLSPVPTESGMLVLSAIRDITDRKRIEQELHKAHAELAASKDRELRESQDRLALIVDSSQDAIIAKTLEGTITHWNKGAEHIYGYTAEEVIGKPISMLAPDERRDETMEILAKIRQGSRVDHFETTRVRKDGKHLNVSISVSPIQDATGQIIGASVIARDVTGQKRSEELLRQAQKMEAVGRLAGGVAHDFNNVLGIITACCELLRSHLSRTASRNTSTISRRRPSAAPHSLASCFLSAENKSAPSAPARSERCGQGGGQAFAASDGDDVQVVVRHGAEVAVVESDPAQLDQIILNIAVNARDAMPKGGKLILETSVQEFDAGLAERHPPMKAGRYVLLAISDNGIGMDDKILSQIFEPFFTTKEAGKARVWD